MSRGVKDLREMVCLSRHSVANDIKCVGTTEELSDATLNRLSSSTARTKRSGLPDLINECHIGGNCANNSIDREELKAFDVSHTENIPAYLHPLVSDDFRRHTKTEHQLNIKPNLREEDSVHWGSVSRDRHNGCSSVKAASDKDTNYDEIMQHFSKDFILTWLEQVKRSICDLSDWCQGDENFVKFAHSWLSQFSEETRSKVLDLEFNILKDQLPAAFRGKSLSIGVLDSLLAAVLHEFCDGCLTGQRGAYLFLDYMDSLSSSQSHRAILLADVKCSRTCMKSQYYECILAIRSFAIVSIWSAILDWYRAGDGSGKVQEDVRRNGTARSAKGTKSARPKSGRPRTARNQVDDSPVLDYADLSKERIYQAVRLGYIDVVQFMLDTCRVSADVRDSTNKTLVFSAVTSNQPAVLRFLLQQTDCYLYVNVAADSGNTPLHAAANRGDISVARELLKVRDIKVDALNHMCENATPLHLAAMHGHTETVLLLLNFGANPSRTMGNKTAFDIARDFEHEDIVSLLQPQISRGASVLYSARH